MWWWRRVRDHSYWLPGHSLNDEGLPYYAVDVTVDRDRGDKGLSVYSAADLHEADKVSHYYALTLRSPAKLDYILIPDPVWDMIELCPKTVQYNNLHPYLNARHCEVFDLTVDLEIQLAQIILRDLCRRAFRLLKSEIQEAAKKYLAEDGSLRNCTFRENLIVMQPDRVGR